MYGLKERDVIRVKVKYCDNEKEPQIKKFAIDPRLTNFEVLNGLLVKGLNIKWDFVIHYLATDDFGEQFYLPLLSDWDLDAAILTASDPILRLKVNLKQKEKEMEDWDIVVPGEAPFKLSRSNLNGKSITNLFKSDNHSSSHHSNSSQNSRSSSGFFSNFYQQMEKTVNSFQRVFSNSKLNEVVKPLKNPMSDIEFRNYMDNIGRIVQPDEFKRSVYLGGLEPSLRKVGWRLLLNVYPEGLNGRERLNLLEKKTKHYRSLKNNWKTRFKANKLTEQELAQIALVSVDVIRTDRGLNFYSSEKNFHHVCQLFDILATYCLYHPSVGYYQGMSDLASPLLFVQQGDEAVAYLCFCSLMSRVSSNFTTSSSSSNNPSSSQTCAHNQHQQARSRGNSNSSEYNNSHTTSVATCSHPQCTEEPKNLLGKLKQLRLLLQHIDPILASHLSQHRMLDCHFAHRWLLLEMKREFPFCDSLRLLEIQWASLIMKPSVANQPNTGSNTTGVSLVEESLLMQQSRQDNRNSGSENSNNPRSSKVRCYAIRDMSLMLSLIGTQYTPSSNNTSISSSSGNVHTGSTRSSTSIPPTSPIASIFSDLESVFVDNNVTSTTTTTATTSSILGTDINLRDKSKSAVTSPTKDMTDINYTATFTVGENSSESASKRSTISRKSSFSDFDDDDDDDAYENNNAGNPSNNGYFPVKQSTSTISDNGEDNNNNNDEANSHSNDPKMADLPPPHELGHGNPLLMFLCVSMLLEYREIIIRGVQETADLLLLYQKLQHRHNMLSVLTRAQQLFQDYLRDWEIKRRNLQEFPELHLSM